VKKFLVSMAWGVLEIAFSLTLIAFVVASTFYIQQFLFELIAPTCLEGKTLCMDGGKTFMIFTLISFAGALVPPLGFWKGLEIYLGRGESE